VNKIIYLKHFALTIISLVISSGLCLVILSFFGDDSSTGTGALAGGLVIFAAMMLMWLIFMFISSVVTVNLLL